MFGSPRSRPGQSVLSVRVLSASLLIAVASSLVPGTSIMSSATAPALTRAPVRLCDAEELPGPELYNVFLLNDNHNMREYVSRALMMVCELSESDAGDVMMQANRGGQAVVGTWEGELAEHVYDGMTQAGLNAALWPVGEESSMLSRIDWLD